MEVDRNYMKYFKMYKEVNRKLQHFIDMRGTCFGIGVDSDEYAIKWQGYRMRLEIIEAKLEGRNPNWFNAYYLDRLEMTIRNESYNVC